MKIERMRLMLHPLQFVPYYTIQEHRSGVRWGPRTFAQAPIYAQDPRASPCYSTSLREPRRNKATMIKKSAISHAALEGSATESAPIANRVALLMA
jgi:hypothetical protein